jgi:hypothetical protein
VKRLSGVLALVAPVFMTTAALTQTAVPFVITNDDNPAGNSASIIQSGAGLASRYALFRRACLVLSQ